MTNKLEISDSSNWYMAVLMIRLNWDQRAAASESLLTIWTLITITIVSYTLLIRTLKIC